MSDWIAANRRLDNEEMEHNARIFYEKMSSYGFSLNAIAAMLGNIQVESKCNPGAWQNYKPGSAGGGGYGLVQWTPWTNYSEWAGSGWENNGDKQCERIAYEFEHGLQYYSTKAYPLSAQQFKTSDKSPAYLATAFLYNYERPRDKNQPNRRKYAEQWYKFLSGEEPPKPEPVDPDQPIDPDYPPEPTIGLEAWKLFRFPTLFNSWGKRSTH